MSEKKYPIKWEVKSHSYQIADTGDYDGYWEVTNGKDSLITKDDYEDIEKDLQELANLLNDIYPNFTIDRGNEAALEAENRWLKDELEQLKAQPGPVWEKAERQLPVPGTYNAKKDGKPFVLKFMEADKRMPKEYWKGVEWLDESPAEQPVREVEAIEFARWILDNNYKPYAGEWYLNGNHVTHHPRSTNMLYQEFKQPPAEWSGEKEVKP